MVHSVYILRCSDDTYYTGYTNHLQKRLETHNKKMGAKYTRGRTPLTLIYHEEYDDEWVARSREYEIKQLSRSKKESLIATYVS